MEHEPARPITTRLSLAASRVPASVVRPLLRLDAEVLFRAGPEVEILHSGEVYRLRRTRLGKLILTK
jgi:hemin uptake protein HemP